MPNVNSLSQSHFALSQPVALNGHGQPRADAPMAVLYGKALTFDQLTALFSESQSAVALCDTFVLQGVACAIVRGEWAALDDKLTALALDFAPLANIPDFNQPGLLVMDMDSTAIEIECIDEIAKLAGTGDEVARITESAMRGELDFAQSLRKRVATLKGADEAILAKVRSTLPLMPGLETLIAQLHAHGWHAAIASGGFTYFADFLKDKLGLLAAVSNRFEIINGKLTGQVQGDIVDATYKANTLNALREQLGLAKSQVIAIGDGANDLAMMAQAGLGIAYHAKPKVQQQAEIKVNFCDLTALLILLTAKQRSSNL
ncbi:phosphoserine phosphatase SerB [Pasteurellaceae bacterium HPA106]|uniref:phosphoserine phosphatase SerB n=1 Tax=Spirabiliibacterium pneumoniae TaxID=221400 RepID=UPI001AAC918D|nr:phosphoserine phosphatase SerB [Spirabiliibacterium pneumoniae]MBE2896412.1 phosphoserine phosphatase SerB [Spirabiliibacterium pneumoniae]